MSQFGPTELLIVLVIVLLIFGPKRLPALGRQLGGGIREFRKSIGGSDDDSDADAREAGPERRGRRHGELERGTPTDEARSPAEPRAVRPDRETARAEDEPAPDRRAP